MEVIRNLPPPPPSTPPLHPPQCALDMWTFTVLHSYHVEEFNSHINSRAPHIKFTVEEATGGSLVFLNTKITVKEDGSTKIQICRKPTHTDQYLNCESNHPLSHKRSVVRTLLSRAENLVTEQEDKNKETTHIKNVLCTNLGCTRYPRRKTKMNLKTPTENMDKTFTPRNIRLDSHTQRDCQKNCKGFLNPAASRHTTNRATH